VDDVTQASDPNRLDRLEALLETTVLAIRELSKRQDRTQSQLDQVADRQEANDRQIALNSEQIASNTAGLIELRNLIADFVRNQSR
jgi:response regulator of citrate/malate metabolism